MAGRAMRNLNVRRQIQEELRNLVQNIRSGYSDGQQWIIRSWPCGRVLWRINAAGEADAIERFVTAPYLEAQADILDEAEYVSRHIEMAGIETSSADILGFIAFLQTRLDGVFDWLAAVTGVECLASPHGAKFADIVIRAYKKSGIEISMRDAYWIQYGILLSPAKRSNETWQISKRSSVTAMVAPAD